MQIIETCKGLVVSSSKAEPPWAGDDVVSVGSAGVFYLDRLVYSKEYISAVADDTNVYDQEVFRALVDIHKDNTLGSERNTTWWMPRLTRLTPRALSRRARAIARDIAVAQFGSGFLATKRPRSRPPPRGGKRRR